MSIGSITVEPQTTQTWTPSVHVPPSQVFQDRCCQIYRCLILWNFLPCVSISMPIKLGNHQQHMEVIHAQLVTYPPPSAPSLCCLRLSLATNMIYSTSPPPSWSSSISIPSVPPSQSSRLDHHLCLLLLQAHPLTHYNITTCKW